jgi:hypothetical protein
MGTRRRCSHGMRAVTCSLYNVLLSNSSTNKSRNSSTGRSIEVAYGERSPVCSNAKAIELAFVYMENLKDFSRLRKNLGSKKKDQLSCKLSPPNMPNIY